jgi:Crp-like helix-turn-helix domain
MLIRHTPTVGRRAGSRAGPTCPPGLQTTSRGKKRNSSEKRLARALLLLANFGKEGRPEPIIAKVSQETLAEMIGTTRSRVSFFMNKFRQLGFIEYNGNLEIHSSLLSVVLHDQPHIIERDRPLRQEPEKAGGGPL